jgi:DNA-binding transcriptional regulator YdaS (Cro superfamily)
MNSIATAVEKLGAGQAGIARLLGVTPQAVNQWVSGNRPVPPRHVLAIEAATGVSRHELRPDVFGPAPVASGRQVIGALVDTRMSKRALRARLGLSSDAHLAKLLKLPAAEVETWPEEQSVPALPQVLQLLGVQEVPAAQAAAQDPDADRIITVEAA